jgi:hypothetical protein
MPPEAVGLQPDTFIIRAILEADFGVNRTAEGCELMNTIEK